MSAVDPNWLLSTAAQSAAAIVAIVGGFLVSRVISLRTETNELEHQRRDLEKQREVASAELSEVKISRRIYAALNFRTFCLDQLAAGEGIPGEGLPWLVDSHDYDEVQEMIASVRAEVRAGEEVLVDVGLDEFRRLADSLDPVTGPTEVYRALLDREEAAASPFGFVARPGQGLDERLAAERQERRIQRAGELTQQLELLNSQLATIEIGLSAREEPDGIVGGVVVLAYFGIVGVVVPLVMMGQRPVPSSEAARRVVLTLFISGFLLVLGYLVVSVGRLLKR